MYVWINTHVYDKYVCMYMYMYSIYVYICIYIYIYIYIYICSMQSVHARCNYRDCLFAYPSMKFVHVSISIHMRENTNTCMHMCLYIHDVLLAHEYVAHAYICVCVCVLILM